MKSEMDAILANLGAIPTELTLGGEDIKVTASIFGAIKGEAKIGSAKVEGEASSHQPLAIDGTDPRIMPLLDALHRGGGGAARESRLELRPVGVVVDPGAGRLDELAGADGRRMPVHGHPDRAARAL